MELRGRNALVTGAGGGLGEYIAKALAAEGVDLALTDLAEPNELAQQVRGQGVTAETLSADLTDTAGLETLVRHADEALGPIDILVNNAGLEFMGPFTAQTREQLELITSVNLLAVMELTRVVLPGMLERGRGHVVNVASLAGRIPGPYLHTYNATKHGVVGFTHALRGELADTPVSISAVCPGFISGVGMIGRVEADVEIPSSLGTEPPEKVGEAVVRAIREDVPEVIVNRRPVRPVVAFASIFPGAAQKLLRRMGVGETGRDIGEAYGRRSA